MIRLTLKDWTRMSDLVLAGKDGEGVAATIKDREKAAARFICGLKLFGSDPRLTTYGRDTYSCPFDEFGNRAVALGADPAEILQAFQAAQIPAEIEARMEQRSNKKLRDRFVGSLSRAILDAGFDIRFLPHNGNAITIEGIEAMWRNGRKWTIGYIAEVVVGETVHLLRFDAITDEGDGPTSYVLDYNGNSGVFQIQRGMRHGKLAFIDGIVSSITP